MNIILVNLLDYFTLLQYDDFVIYHNYIFKYYLSKIYVTDSSYIFLDVANSNFIRNLYHDAHFQNFKTLLIMFFPLYITLFIIYLSINKIKLINNLIEV